MKTFRIGNAMIIAWVLIVLAVLMGSLSGQSGVSCQYRGIEICAKSV